MTENKKEVVKVVDITPTWKNIFPILKTLIMSENKDKSILIEEIQKLCEIADRYIEVQKIWLNENKTYGISEETKNKLNELLGKSKEDESEE